jgi:coniferyl-aldehyde dehydrogenase
MNDTSRDHMLDVLARQRQDYLREGAVTAAVRHDRLERAIGLLKTHQQRLVDAMTADFGHRSEHQSLFTDIAASIGPLRHAQKHLARWMKPEKRKVGPFPLNLLGAKARVEYQPLGVVGVISPWNFPVNLTFTPLAGILAAGNRCMIKPSEYTPATSQVMAEIFPTAFDELEIAWSPAARRPAPISPACRSITCCSPGATSVARHVMRAAAENLVPVTLELGGKSPVVVGRSVDMQKTTDAIMTGKMLNAGQICLAPDYVFVPEERIEEFVSASQKSVAKMYPTLLDNADYTSIINQRHFDRLNGYIAEARNAGARVVEINPGGRGFPPAAASQDSAYLDCQSR